MTPSGITSGPQAILLVVNPSGNRQRMVLQPLPFTIGRQADCNLVLRDNRASRQHARLYSSQGDYFVEDMNSRHGVLVNGTRILAPWKLSSGDTVEFGVQDSYKVIFTVEEAEIQKLMDQIGSASRTGAPTNLSKLRALVEVARTVQSALSTETVLAAVVDAALTVTGSQRGFLMLQKGEDLEIVVGRDHQGRPLPTELDFSTRIIHRALAERRDLLTMNFDLVEQIRNNPDDSTSRLPVRSVVCVPLVKVRQAAKSVNADETMILGHQADTVGVIYLESRLGSTDLTTGDRELLQTLAIEASTILENARLLEQERLRMKMDEELKIAREIQQSLMPRKLPTAGWFRAAAASIPSHQVGGDYCDVRQIGPDVWGFVVADVSGKGVSSALLASLLQGAFLAGGHSTMRIDELMTHVNQFLNERTEGEKYATLFCGVVNREGRLRWSNAGHCPPLVLRASGELLKLEATSLPLGLIEEAEYSVSETQLLPGDKIAIYTDGVSEAQNAAGKFFDPRRIELLLKAGSNKGCQELIHSLVAAVEAFTEGMPQGDDLTAVVLEYVPGEPV